MHQLVEVHEAQVELAADVDDAVMHLLAAAQIQEDLLSAPIAALAVLGTACTDDDDADDVGGSMMPPGSSALMVKRTDIVADEPGARVRDALLVNAWGLAFNPVGVAWVSATETGVSAVYDANGNSMIPAVVIPSTELEEPSAPTGQVHNDDPNSFEGDIFIFVTEGGTISGWQQTMGGQATQRVDNSADEAIYKGVTIVTGANGPRLFAADFHGAKIDVFDSTYAAVETEGFSDPDLPEGFAPFNVEELNGAVVDDLDLARSSLGGSLLQVGKRRFARIDGHS